MAKYKHWVVWLALLAATNLAAAPDDSANSDRPKLPRYFTTLDPVSAGVYDSRAVAIAELTEAIKVMNMRGWEMIRKYFATLGTYPENAEPRVNPADLDDPRFFANFTTEEPGRSPMPLISMICSLSASQVSGPLLTLQQELRDAINVDNYDTWQVADLHSAIDKLTETQTNVRFVKYRAPKPHLSFKQAVELYSMNLALIRKDTKWADWKEKVKAQGHTTPALPDMNDLANRLMHQLPVDIKDRSTAYMLLYRPGDIDQPVSKGEFEERADVVVIKRAAADFALEEFPIYLTADQKEWNPAWIQPKDEIRDPTLMARKYEYDWTRFDGPYLWYRRDQLNAPVVYKATVRFPHGNSIVIEADRFVAGRGAVKHVRRDPQYNPATMTPFVVGVDSQQDPLTADLLDLEAVQPIPRYHRAALEQCFYRTEGREMLNYQTGPNAFGSYLYPPASAMAGAATQASAEGSKADALKTTGVAVQSPAAAH